MTFVITRSCCNDAACVPVCPVQCIRPRPGDPEFLTAEQLYIDPVTCIDCGACVDECPVSAIYPDYEVPEQYADYTDINAAYFGGEQVSLEPMPDRVRRHLPAERPLLRVAIVGSGPSACYAAAALSEVRGVTISVFDRLPTPFGLARYGVAPDHADTKRVINSFQGILSRRSVSCYFNVEVGTDVTLAELLQYHHAVIWAGGATDDNTLGIPGEHLPGSVSAREFVAWYNGHPDAADRDFDLDGRRVVIIGNGNVAIDVARILTRPVEDLESTDVADHALAVLRGSTVEDVVVAARRGAESAAFSLPEVLALSQLQGVDLLADEQGVRPARPPANELAGRKLDIIARASAASPTEGNRSINLRFLLTPLSVNGADRVESVTFARNEVIDTDGRITVRPTDDTETIEASLVLRAVGYRGKQPLGLSFDEASGTIPNSAGRVVDSEDGTAVVGLYCTGWIKRGATGVIGTNKLDSSETVDSLLADFGAGLLPDPDGGDEELAALIAERRPDRVDYPGWLRINEAEMAAGARESRPRVKIVSLEELVATASGVVPGS